MDKQTTDMDQEHMDAITEIKHILEESNNRVNEAEELISELEDRMEEITEAEQNKEKKILMRRGL